MNPMYGSDHGPPQFAAQGGYFPQLNNLGMMAGAAAMPGPGMIPGLSVYNPLNPYPQPPPYPLLGPPLVYPWMQNGANVMQPRAAGPVPRIDPSMPANQMTNSTGGTGCEPGYNYFFAPEHAKVHVLKTPTKPWQLPQGAQIPFHAAHVPVTTTCAELLKGFGATNPTPKLNRCFEVVQGGNGRWYKGYEFSGADKNILSKPIKDIGWDKSRTGHYGERPVVCLWISKGA